VAGWLRLLAGLVAVAGVVAAGTSLPARTFLAPDGSARADVGSSVVVLLAPESPVRSGIADPRASFVVPGSRTPHDGPAAMPVGLAVALILALASGVWATTSRRVPTRATRTASRAPPRTA
jgi:hypothetical protein